MAREIRSGNPTMRTLTRQMPTAAAGERMSVGGTVGKTALLFLLLAMTAGWCWHRFFTGGPAAVEPFILVGALGGLALGLATSFKPNWAHITAPLYAILEGLFVGAISALLTARYGAIVMHAVLLTFGVMVTMLTLYTSGVIKVTRKFQMGVMAATGGVMIFYLVTWILGLFHVHTGYLFYGSTTSLVVSVAILVIAALNLVLDFAFIDEASRNGAPKYMEWYGAFALTVTLVWLYLEALRLMANLNARQ